LQKINSVSNVKKGLKLKWKAQKKCDGYYIIQEKTGNGKFSLAATVKKGKYFFLDRYKSEKRKEIYLLCKCFCKRAVRNSEK